MAGQTITGKAFEYACLLAFQTKLNSRNNKVIIEARLKDNCKTSIILTFDGGWEITMRLHNKDEVAKITSLAWNVDLTGMPPDIYQQQRSWDE